LLKAKTVKTTVIYKFSHIDTGGGVAPGGGGGFGGGLGVGDTVGGGGVVTSVTESSITVNFPQGVPNAPINLPGVDTTVVVEQSGSKEEGSSSLSPFVSNGETVQSSVGMEVEGLQVGSEVEGIRTRYELPRPGSLANSVRIQPRVFEEPRNDSSCACAVFIASWDAGGQMLDNIMLKPGESIPEYRPPAGAVVTRFACSGGCSGECTCSISVKSSLVG
jgi:hypothetical protein